MTPRDPAQLLTAARRWIEDDPDPVTRAELLALVEAGELRELESRLGELSFGTAGLRARVGAGSARMNRAVVIRAAYGLARYLATHDRRSELPVVIGFDARPTSRAFAEESAAVLLAAGVSVLAFPEPIATPLVAFAAREAAARLAIVVTASHNPRPDNGYKVYGPDAVQIAQPLDALIAAEIAAAPGARDVPRIPVDFGADALPAGLRLLGEPELERYFAALTRALPRGELGRTLRIVHSALHGVGTAPARRALADAGFGQVLSVAEQSQPDGAFPTTPFPNPEEPGTLDLALALGERERAELVLVNDPDADRLGAAARLDGALVPLDGNQIGCLLMHDALSRRAGAPGTSPRPLVLTSVVSSPLAERIAEAAGARYERTLTGFKWLWTAVLALEREGAGRFCFAFEEALGFSVLAEVRDKDGISAARALAELAATEHASGRSLFDRLFEIYARHGLWSSAAQNLSLEGGDAQQRLNAALERFVQSPPMSMGGERITRVLDYRSGAEQRPRWLGEALLLELSLESGGRLFARPSGTEPKLKLYAHVRRSVTQRSELAASLAEARRHAAGMLREFEAALGF